MLISQTCRYETGLPKAQVSELLLADFIILKEVFTWASTGINFVLNQAITV